LIKGARIWRGAVNAQSDKLDNIAFLRTRIEQLELFFGEAEVDEIWITFPDPFLGKESRRLTANNFLEKYKKILAPGAKVNLKTDSRELYDFTREVLENRSDVEVLIDNPDIYKAAVDPTLEIKTYYEKMHLAKGKKITYLQFIYI